MKSLTVSCLPIHENGMSFHLIMVFKISIRNVLEFSIYKPFTSLTKLQDKETKSGVYTLSGNFQTKQNAQP